MSADKSKYTGNPQVYNPYATHLPEHVVSVQEVPQRILYWLEKAQNGTTSTEVLMALAEIIMHMESFNFRRFSDLGYSEMDAPDYAEQIVNGLISIVNSSSSEFSEASIFAFKLLQKFAFGHELWIDYLLERLNLPTISSEA
jgi:hypothetical protein